MIDVMDLNIWLVEQNPNHFENHYRMLVVSMKNMVFEYYNALNQMAMKKDLHLID